MLANNKKAFTLIELLIVIAIIGILFIVLVSRVDFATDKAKASGVQTDFRAFQMALNTVAQENAGFNTFGWDTGDENGDGIRNSYDKGDNGAGGGIAQNGIQDGSEVFVGSKVYGETWEDIWTLVKPGTSEYDQSALIALEVAINKNLDPKLHITIASDGKITMANQARDPWKNEYHGYYITNAEADKGDRGAIVMYSNGPNGKWGSAHDITNGVVSVTVPGNNVNGKDDYAISVVYSHLDGHGLVYTDTHGFGGKPNAETQNGNINNQPIVPDNPETPTPDPNPDPGLPDVDPDVNMVAGLYQSGTIQSYKSGAVDDISSMMTMSWNDLLTQEIIRVDNGVVYTDFNTIEWTNPASEFLVGDLILPSDGSVTKIGDAYWDEEAWDDYYEDFGTYVGKWGFAMCENLTDVYIPNTVELLASSAFDSCYGLTHIEIPNSVKKIDEFAFYDCAFDSIVVPESVEYIGTSAFVIRGLQSMIIKNENVFIFDVPFADGESLTHLEIGDLSIDVTFDTNAFHFASIDYFYQVDVNCYAVYFVSSQDREVVFNGWYVNDVLESTTRSVFLMECSESILVEPKAETCNITGHVWVNDVCEKCSLQAGLYDENDNLIASWHSLINDYGLDLSVDNVEDIGWPTERIVFAPNSLYKILQNNSELSTGTKLVIGTSANKFGMCAFADVTLSYLYIPASVVDIQPAAFYSFVTNEFDVDVLNTQYCDYNKDLYSKDKSVYIRFAEGYRRSYITVPDGVTVLASGVLAMNTEISELILPESLKTIEDYALYLLEVPRLHIPATVNYIGYRANSYNGRLQYLTFAENCQVEEICDYAFYQCVNLLELTLPENLLKVGTGAFEYCESLKTLVLNDLLVYIGSYAFAHWESLTEVSIPGSVCHIGGGAFKSSMSPFLVHFRVTDGWNSYFGNDLSRPDEEQNYEPVDIETIANPSSMGNLLRLREYTYFRLGK